MTVSTANNAVNFPDNTYNKRPYVDDGMTISSIGARIAYLADDKYVEGIITAISCSPLPRTVTISGFQAQQVYSSTLAGSFPAGIEDTYVWSISSIPSSAGGVNPTGVYESRLMGVIATSGSSNTTGSSAFWFGRQGT
jgi:hypothetical protein